MTVPDLTDRIVAFTDSGRNSGSGSPATCGWPGSTPSTAASKTTSSVSSGLPCGRVGVLVVLHHVAGYRSDIKPPGADWRLASVGLCATPPRGHRVRRVGRWPCDDPQSPAIRRVRRGPGLAEAFIDSGAPVRRPVSLRVAGIVVAPAAMHADQADAYALLLDSLRIGAAAVFGYSAGGPTAIQFALRRAERTTALILMASAVLARQARPRRRWRRRSSDRIACSGSSGPMRPPCTCRSSGCPRFRPAPGSAGASRRSPTASSPSGRASKECFRPVCGEPGRADQPAGIDPGPHPHHQHQRRRDVSSPAPRTDPQYTLMALDRGGHLLLGSDTRIPDEIAAFPGSEG
jgi:pimeloyl-ACP methyl ester carboxylesterase